ncbi:MAG: ArsC family transcriptional regulator [Candidatus Delongbacteria bacterium]|nr:ArsC family transcriptional regulator [Candidatus Delongbacteria bacterium]MBN2836941.1 ArsC family transcriptional regulator [Candidatus Delongbacteria bacterium]
MAQIQIFGTKKCNITRKAERFFKERKCNFQFIDLSQKGFSEGELTSIVKSAFDGDASKMIDTKSKEFSKSNLAYIQYDSFELLLEKPLLSVTPIIRKGSKAISGDCPEDWKTFLD